MKLLCYCFLLPPTLAAESILAGKALRHLADRFEVTAVAASDALYPRDPELEQCLRGVRVRRPSAYPRPARVSRRALLRLAADEALLWIPRAVRAGDAADVLYSRSEPGASHLAALRWRRLHPGTPWVAHFSDPWANSPYRAGHPPRLRAAMRRGESRVCAAADWFVFPSQVLRERFAADHARVWERSSVLPHGFEPDWYPRRQPQPVGTRVRPILAHVGDFYGPRSPEPLLRASEGLDAEVRLYGRVARQLRPLLDRSWVRYAGPVPYRDSLRAMVEADLLVVVEAPGRDSPFLPSKLVDYLGAGRPIAGLIPPSSPTAGLLARFGFPFADVADPAGCRRVLRFALDHLPQLEARAQANDYAEFEMPRIGRRLADLVAALARGDPPE